MKQCFQEWNEIQGRSGIPTEVREASPTFILAFCWGVSSKPKYTEANTNRELSKINRSEFGGAEAAGICGSRY